MSLGTVVGKTLLEQPSPSSHRKLAVMMVTLTPKHDSR